MAKSQKIKIAHLSSVHQTFDTRIFRKECTTLANEGYDVVFIVPHTHNELVNGVKIHAVPPPSGRKERMMHTVFQMYKAALHENAQIYHFHDPELIIVGLMLKLKGKRVIYDVHEDVPQDILTKEYIPGPLRFGIATIANAIEKTAAIFFDRIVAVTPAILQRFPSSKAVLVQNYPIIGELMATNEKQNKSQLPFVVYVGGITSIRGIKEMVDAMALLPESLQVRLVLAGEFSPAELESRMSKSSGWKRVDFIGWQSREGLKDLLAQARAGLVLFHPGPNHNEAQPNKLFEYMSAGLPVIASKFPLWQEIVEGAGCGLVVDPLNPVEIAEAITWVMNNSELAESKGENGLEAVKSRYNWNVEAQKLVEMYNKMLNS